MGLTQIYDDYYEIVKPFNAGPTNMCVGQIAWVPAYFIEQIPYVLDFERETPTDHYAVKFKIRKMGNTDFLRRTKLPVQGMSLFETEECLAVKAKKRPCIMLAKNLTLSAPAMGPGITQKTKTHLLHDAALFLPLYGVDDASHVGGIPQAMVDRIKVLMYDQFFYFKKGYVKESKDFMVESSVGRFDRMFVSTLLHPAVSPTDGKLTNDILNVVVASLARYLKLPLEKEKAETFATIISLVQEAMPK